MAIKGWGIRAKTTWLVVAITTVVLVGLLGGSFLLLKEVRTELGSALARNTALRTQQRLQAEVGRDVALAQRLAGLSSVQDWLRDEEHPEKKARFVADAEKFRTAFDGASYFVASEKSRTFHYADTRRPLPTPGYVVRADNPANAWYFTTLARADGVWVNVDHDTRLGVTNVWINVASRDEAGVVLGVVGTGIELTRFLSALLASRDPGVTTMILDAQGAVVAHPDPSRIEFDLAAKAKAAHPVEKTVFRSLADPQDPPRLRAVIADALAHPDAERVSLLTLDLEDRSQIVAVAALPALGWVVLSAVDLSQGVVLTPLRLAVGGAGIVALMVLAAVATGIGFDRLVLRPLLRLSESIEAVRQGRYSDTVTSTRADEIGALTRAFDTMARQVQAHSEHLEHLVAERTGELAAVNDRMREAHRQLTDSIRYASLIQSAILPDRRLRETFRGGYFVLWRPRDVVGGDFYLYRGNDTGCLFGVVDCAGHGVPGACMTMLAHGALDTALRDTPWADPAAVLTRVDAIARAMLPGDDRDARVATNMDMGLAYVNLRARTVTFAGARLALFWSDGESSGQCVGDRRGLNDRKRGQYTNDTVSLRPGCTFYLVTDGLFDQAGGPEGFGFGQRRFAEWVQDNAALPLEDQKTRLIDTLDRYKGERAQRDDMTVLAFRFDDLI